MGLSPKWSTYLPASVKSSLPNPWKLRSIKAMGPVGTAFDVLEAERLVNILLPLNDEGKATDGLRYDWHPSLLISLTDPIQQAKCFHHTNYSNYSSYSTEVTVVEAFGLLLGICQAD